MGLRPYLHAVTFKKCRSISQITKAVTFIQRSLALQLTLKKREENIQRQNSHKTSQHFHKIHKHQHHLPFINPAFLVSLNLILQLLYSFNVSSYYFLFLLIKLNFGIECICQTTILQRNIHKFLPVEILAPMLRIARLSRMWNFKSLQDNIEKGQHSCCATCHSTKSRDETLILKFSK